MVFTLSNLDLRSAPLPLPNSVRGNLDPNHGEEKASRTRFVPKSTPEIRAKALEARKLATPKHVIAEAIAAKCLECTGVNPAITDCGGEEVNDGKPCRLYHVNTREKRFKVTKTSLRKAIVAECHFCLGNWKRKTNPLSDCSSPTCALYPLGAGPAVAKREGREA